MDKDKYKRSTLLLVWAGFLLILSACAQAGNSGEVKTDQEQVDLQQADSVVAQITMGAGNLEISGGSQALMEADFTYNVDVWKPNVDYSVSQGVGNLSISQPANIELDRNLTNFRYDWNVRLNNDVPLDLRVDLGAGSSTLKVGSLDLTGLDVAAGAGDIRVDLSGEQGRDLGVSIRGGVGNLTVVLPSQTGVKVDVTGGLGQVIATGLTRNEQGSFVSPSYGTAEHTLNVNIEGGLGEVNLEVVQ
jgi:hypothetical protein